MANYIGEDMSGTGYHYVIEERGPGSISKYKVTIYDAETGIRLWSTFTDTKWGARRWAKRTVRKARSQRERNTVVEEGML